MADVIMNGHTYLDNAADFTANNGRGHMQPGISGSTLFPNQVFTDMLAEIAARLVTFRATLDKEIIVPGTAFVHNAITEVGIRIGYASTITTLIARVGTAPTGASLIVVVKLNPAGANTTIATLTIAAAALISTGGTGLSTAVVAGDIIGFNITQVGSTIPGSGLAVQMIGA